MSKTTFCAAATCLLLCGCGAYDLGGMPRVVSNGGFAPTQPNRAAESRAREERRHWEVRTQLLTTQQAMREREIARLDAERVRLQGQQADLQGRLGRPGLTAEARRDLAGQITTLEQQITGIESDLAELSTQQIDSLAVDAGPRLSQTGAGRPPPGRLETFPERFVRYGLAAQASEDDPELATQHEADVQRMLQSGFLLIQSNCDDFFSRTAIIQRDADIGRDMVAPIITLLTGIVAARSLTEDSSDDLLHIFTIAGNAALAGISIVDQRFLFGAENIVEVRDLTFDAFQASEDEIAEQVAEHGALSFDGAARRLIDYQLICTPSYILRLTRAAISGGRVVRDTNAPPLPDDNVRAELADHLDLEGRTTDRQTRALWQLFIVAAANDVPDALVTELQAVGLGDLVVPTDTATGVKAHLSNKGALLAPDMSETLRELSPGTQERYRAPAGVAGNGQPRSGPRSGALPGRTERPAPIRNPGRRVRLRVD